MLAPARAWSDAMAFMAEAELPLTPGSIGTIASQKITGFSAQPRMRNPVRLVRLANDVKARAEVTLSRKGVRSWPATKAQHP
jgi:hypothetical protein